MVILYSKFLIELLTVAGLSLRSHPFEDVVKILANPFFFHREAS